VHLFDVKRLSFWAKDLKRRGSFVCLLDTIVKTCLGIYTFAGLTDSRSMASAHHARMCLYLFA
jgi:hypothetical protein